MSFLDAIADVGVGFLNNHFARGMQNSAQDYNTRVLQNRHQWEVADLRAAGLNPILSATNSSGGAGIGIGSAGTMPGLGGDDIGNRQYKLSKGQLNVERDKIDLQRTKIMNDFKLQEKQMEHYDNLISNLSIQNSLLKIKEKWADLLEEGDYGIKLATANKLKADATSSFSAANYYNTAADLNLAKKDQVYASIRSIDAAIPKMKADGRITSAQADLIETYNGIIKAHPELYSAKVVAELMSGSIDPALKIIGSVVNGYQKIKSAGPITHTTTNNHYGDKNHYGDNIWD